MIAHLTRHPSLWLTLALGLAVPTLGHAAREVSSLRDRTAKEEQAARARDEARTRRGEEARGEARREGRAGEARPEEETLGRRGKRAKFEQVIPGLDRIPKVSTRSPGLAVFLFDTSGSMADPFGGETGQTKIEALARVGNEVLENFTLNFRDGDGFKNRLDVLSLTYNGQRIGNAFGGTLADKPIVTISELADGAIETTNDLDKNGDSLPRPVWLKPVATGRTPTSGAFDEAGRLIKGWTRRPQKEHLVLAVHVTDGQSTDGDPAAKIENLRKEVEAGGGKLLLTNIHLSSTGSPGRGVIFPNAADAEKFDEYGKRLFELSSPLPPDLAKRLGIRKKGARMMAFNASPEQLEKVFVAGSTAAAE